MEGSKTEALRRWAGMNIDEASVKHLCNLYVETCQCFLTRLSSSLLFRKCILVPPALSRPAYTCFFFCIIYKTPIMFATRKLHFLWWLRRWQSIRTVCMVSSSAWISTVGSTDTEEIRPVFSQNLSYIHILVQITCIQQRIIYSFLIPCVQV